ncbi:MgtC/SapB family protein [Dyella caseinilytica]|uniref:Protein MgtC n=1 Tax=Dyella caseinilytica TaxID=1849581 RepID=A0ABX7GUT0_9GAMM|nr:MgtC/SapB family protein [Dyella caseinilytica]QRN54182.1 MgtC/SapB family protein [Dyella caseinilytica]GFZ92153.1 MgtC family membrane protein [Dyella caseinilytica]
MIDAPEVLLRLALAAVLGAVIGLNRSRNEWAAGMRTHMLVSVGSALAIIVSAFGFRDVLGHPDVVLDPSRIAAQVVSGIGFLGAGTIMFLQREQIVRGLTTAAGLWATASIGLASGSGLFAAAGIATGLIWLILALLKPLERKLMSWGRRAIPRLRLRLTDATALGSVEAIVSRRHLPLQKIVLRRQEDGDDQVDLIFGPALRNDQLVTLADELRELEGLQSVSFESASQTPSQPPTTD